jgi:glutathione synthase/RimK-type ligase-like ATP-grasp enzyme
VLVDASVLEMGEYSVSDGVLTLESKDGAVEVSLRPPTRGWIRRLAPPLWRRCVTLGTEDAAIRSAWSALIGAVAGAPGVGWLTPLEHLFLRENKLLQVEVAQRLGISTPPTAVCSDRDLLPAVLGDELVVKPLGRSHFTDPAGTEQVVWTRGIDRNSDVLARLAGAPFIVQTRLDAERHLRAVTVSDQCWVCELSARDLPVDWRRDATAHDSFVVASAPEVERDAVRMANALGVGYSSQDWIVSNGIPFFIDLNPAGQWLFLPEAAASVVTGTIATWLTP